MNKEIDCKNLTFQDCELVILRMAIDKAGERVGKKIVNSDAVKEIIKVVEDFIKKKSLICYGGTAINNILPVEDQFYDKNVEFPDYDFFSPTALEDAKELTDIFYEKNYTEVEAKSGQHHGTYKVYVNYMPVADITQIPKEVYYALKKDAVQINGIFYAPPNFLRMSMYLELSRPAGDVSRWEKVLKRLTLLNKHYPLTKINCVDVEFQREMSDTTKEDEIYEVVRNTLVNQGVVFFGGYAITLYSQYMPKSLRKKIERFADFDVLTDDPKTTAEIVKERLKDIDVKNVKLIYHPPIGEIIPENYEVIVGNDTIAFIYKPIACHSYNIIKIAGHNVKIATIDTMLSFYLSFLFTNRPYYNDFSDRILCMSKFLFDVQQKNRLKQKGLLRRFSIDCFGHQETVEEMRAHKTDKFKELKDKRGTREYEEWFLNYSPNFNKKEEKENNESKKNNEKTVSSINKERSKKTNKTFKNMKSNKFIKKQKTKRKGKNRKNKKKNIFNLY